MSFERLCKDQDSEATVQEEILDHSLYQGRLEAHKEQTYVIQA